VIASTASNCYHPGMRQLITRIDDDLHARLKARAEAEHRSLNALVTEVLEAAVAYPVDKAAVLRRRIAGAGLTAQTPQPSGPVLGPDKLRALTRGKGTISDLVELQRGERG
jgi:antitoxin FitA